MVTQHFDKRVALARAHHSTPATEAKAEIGVCMGHDHITGRTLFLLANGAIVPRQPTSQLPSSFVPFNWTPKTFVINTPLHSPSSDPTHPPPSLPPNFVVQLPHVPHADAIATVTGHTPAPLNSDLL